MGSPIGFVKGYLLVNKDAHRVLLQINDAWQAAIYCLNQMSQTSVVLPQSAYEAFRIDTTAPDDEVKIDFGPIVFNVPERPNRRAPDLYVVAQGWLTLEGPNFKQLPLRTKTFGTEVGYFRQKDQALEHVYGAHYDMDEKKPGHPVFHAQLGSKCMFGIAVRDLFKRDEDIVDRLGVIIGTVRLPSAQMDIFSVVAQICADHLIGPNPSDELKKAFARLRNSCDFLLGAGHRLSFLSNPHAAGCYRASHWYEAPAANALCEAPMTTERKSASVRRRGSQCAH